MRFADNFNPEWGYLAPAPSFMRKVRVAVVAAAVGASAGGAVVFSLIARPAAEETSVAARTLAQPADSAAATVNTPGPALVQATTQERRQLPAQPQIRESGHATSVAAGESTAGSTAQGAASIAALAEAPTAIAPTPALAPAAKETVAAANAASVQKKVIKKQSLTWHNAQRERAYSGTYGGFYGDTYGGTYGGSRAPLALLPGGAYPPRGEY
jgi:hypothetical protein